MKVSVVIPVYNEEDNIEACLTSLLKQTVAPDEIIVVDNNCTDRTIDIVKKFPNIKVVTEKKQGMIPARNKGLSSARYDIIARTDADTKVSRNWIARIKRDFSADEDIVAISGFGNYFSDMPLVKRKTYAQGEQFYIKTFQRIFHHPLLVGPNMAMRKTAWEKVKKEVCQEDSIVHEDADLAIHIGYIGKIVFDKKLHVTTSSRRWKKLTPHFEYPYRYLRTLQHHKQSLHGIKKGTELVGNALPKPRKLFKRLRSSASASLRFARAITQ